MDAVLFAPLMIGKTAFTAFVNQLQPPLGFYTLGWGKIVHIRPPEVRVLGAESKNSKKSNLIISVLSNFKFSFVFFSPLIKY